MVHQLVVRESSGIAVIDFVGGLTGMPGVQAVRQRIWELTQAGRTRVVANLSDAGELDRSVVWELVSTHGSLVCRHGGLRLAALSDSARASISAPRLLCMFDVFEREVEAVASFARPGGAHASRSEFFVG